MLEKSAGGSCKCVAVGNQRAVGSLVLCYVSKCLGDGELAL